MSDHLATLTIETEQLRVVIACVAPVDSVCHSKPDCDCDSYSGLSQVDDGSWGHTVYNDDAHEFRPADDDGGCRECDELPEHEYHTGVEENWHPHRQVQGFCNYLAWMTEGDNPEVYYDGPPGIPLNGTPIKFTWDGDQYLWGPA